MRRLFVLTLFILSILNLSTASIKAVGKEWGDFCWLLLLGISCSCWFLVELQEEMKK